MKSYSLSEYPGITGTEVECLRSVGVQDNVDYFCLGAGKIYQKTKDHLGFKRLKEIEGLVGLTVLDSLNPAMGSSLYKTGITSVAEVQNLSLPTLCERMNTSDENLGVRILKEATVWEYSTVVYGQVRGLRQNPLAQATVCIEDKRAVTNSQGCFVISGLSIWDKNVEVEGEGYLKFWSTLQVHSRMQKMDVFLKLSSTDAKSILTFDEWRGATFRRTPDNMIKYRDVEIKDLPENTPLSLYSVGRYEDGHVRLVSLFKTKVGRDITLYRLKVPASALSNVREGQVYYTKNGQITGGDKSKKEFWKELAIKRMSVPAKLIEKVG